jgi:hypothetical protein
MLATNSGSVGIGSGVGANFGAGATGVAGGGGASGVARAEIADGDAMATPAEEATAEPALGTGGPMAFEAGRGGAN